MFKEINRASEVLLDEEKRKTYDNLRKNYKKVYNSQSSNYSFYDIFKKKENKKEKQIKELMPKINNINELNIIIEKYSLESNITYEHSTKVKKDEIISQSIKEGEQLKKGSTINVVISLGIDKEKLKNDNINELGKVPIMMYDN